MKTKILISIFVFSTFIYSNENCVDSTKHNFLKHGLLFALEPTLITFTNFSTSENPIKGYLGALISGKYRYDDNDFFRYGLSLSGRHNNSTYYDTSISNQIQQNIKEKNSYISATINLEWMRYIVTQFKVCPYMGPGIYIGGNYSESYTLNQTLSQTGIRQISLESEWTKKTYGISAGLRAILGCEWMVSQNFSLFLEYNASVGCSYDKSRTNKIFNSEMHRIIVTQNSIIFSPGNIRLGLCVSFKLQK